MRKLGRPTDSRSQDVKNKLIEASIECFSKKDFNAVSIRELAKLAKVNSAMINYYFESKSGLYKEMLRHLMQPLFQEMEILSNLKQEDDPFLIHLETISKVLTQCPEFTNIMMLGILNKQSPFHEFIVQNIISKIIAIFFPIITQKIESGEFRKDLEPQYVVQSMVGLMLHPHMMYETTKDLFETEDRPIFNQKVLKHSYSILINGCKS
ncbi:TetR family transcriptional regulator [bacterium]|nr:TetR family transcriptional regulator [bacterium]